MESDQPPTQIPRRPVVVGLIDPASYRFPSVKEPSIAIALSWKMAFARNKLVRVVVKFFFDGANAANKTTSPYLKTMLNAVAKHGSGIKARTHSV